MNIEDVKQDSIRKMKFASIRISPGEQKWISDNHLSPTKIFRRALEELGYGREK